jgi:hypothetical protein
MKTVIEMAREADLWMTSDERVAAVERFAELVRADEREKYKWDIHSCGPTCKRYACVATREAVEAEREACAKHAEDFLTKGRSPLGRAVGDAIRARRNT